MCAGLSDMCHVFPLPASILACGAYYPQCEERGIKGSELRFPMKGRVGERLSLQEGES